MQNQDQDAAEGVGSRSGEPMGPVAEVQKEPNSARNIQIMLVVGLVLAVVLAVFGNL